MEVGVVLCAELTQEEASRLGDAQTIRQRLNQAVARIGRQASVLVIETAIGHGVGQLQVADQVRDGVTTPPAGLG